MSCKLSMRPSPRMSTCSWRWAMYPPPAFALFFSRASNTVWIGIP